MTSKTSSTRETEWYFYVERTQYWFPPGPWSWRACFERPESIGTEFAHGFALTERAARRRAERALRREARRQQSRREVRVSVDLDGS